MIFMFNARLSDRASRPPEGPTRAVAFAFAAAALLVSSVVAAADPFEIQVYDGDANDPGVASLELHVNYNHAPKRPVSPPEMAWHKQTHFTFEPALGITRFWELGAYFQLAATVDGTMYWAGTKLRTKFVTPEGWHPHLTLGLNFEFAFIPQAFDPDRYGGEIRPILGWEDKYFHVATNPNITFSVAGQGVRTGPELNPAISVVGKIPDIVSLGVEYYASIGPLAKPSPVKSQEHYLFGVANILAFAGWEINFGVGAGLTPSSNDVIVKAIFGREIGRLWGRPPTTARSATPGRV